MNVKASLMKAVVKLRKISPSEFVVSDKRHQIKDVAINSIEKIGPKVPGDKAAIVWSLYKYKSFYDSKDYRRAVFSAQTVTNLSPNDPSAFHRLAIALSRDGQLLRAEKAVLRAIELSNKAPENFFNTLRIIRSKKTLAQENLLDKFCRNNVYGREYQVGSVYAGNQWGATRLSLSDRVHLLKSAASLTPAIQKKTFDLQYKACDFKGAAETGRALRGIGQLREADYLKYSFCLHRADPSADLRPLMWEYNNLRKKSGKKPVSFLKFKELSKLFSNISVAEIKTNGESKNQLQYSYFLAAEKGFHELAQHKALSILALEETRQNHFRLALSAERAGNEKLAAEEYKRCVRQSQDKPSRALERLVVLLHRQGVSARDLFVLMEPFWREFDTDFSVRIGLATIDNEESNEKDSVSTTNFSEEPLNRGSNSKGWALSEISPSKPSVPKETTAQRISLLRNTLLEIDDEGQCLDLYEEQLNLSAQWSDFQLSDEILAYVYKAHNDFEFLRQLGLKILLSASDFTPKNFYRLAYFCGRFGRYEEALEWVFLAERFPSVQGFPKKDLKNRQAETVAYTELLDRAPVDKRVALWEAHLGDKLDGNPLAIFKESVKRAEFENTLHVWVANSKAAVPDELLGMPNVVFCKRESPGYWFALAMAGYLVNNVAFPFEYVHRSGQVHVNTWHGTPLKYLGRDDKGSIFDFGNVSRNFLHATDLLMPNEYTAKIMTERYCLKPFSHGDVRITGHATNDVLFDASEEKKKSLRHHLGLNDQQPVVLYAPTWRGRSNSKVFDSVKLEKDLEELCDQSCFQLIFRGHPYSMAAIDVTKLDACVPDSSISTYDLMAIADVIVSDYSSVAIDFVGTKRPVVFYTYDLEQYRSERGLYLSPEEFPGYVVDNLNELKKTLLSLSEKPEDSRNVPAKILNEWIDRFAPKDDGAAAMRCVDAIISSTKENLKQRSKKKRSLLLHHNFTTCDSTSKLVRNINSIDFDQWDVVVAFDSNVLSFVPEIAESLSQLDDRVQIFPRKGAILQRASELQINSALYSEWRFRCPDQRDVYVDMMSREAYRIFGRNRFDIAIEWGGESTVWSGLFSSSGIANKRFLVLEDCSKDSRRLSSNALINCDLFGDLYDGVVVFDDENRRIVSKSCRASSPTLRKEIRPYSTNKARPERSGRKLAKGNGNPKVGFFAGHLDLKSPMNSLVQVLENVDNVEVAIEASGPFVKKIKHDSVEGISEKLSITATDVPNFASIAEYDFFVDLGEAGSPLSLGAVDALELGIPVLRLADGPDSHLVPALTKIEEIESFLADLPMRPNPSKTYGQSMNRFVSNLIES